MPAPMEALVHEAGTVQGGAIITPSGEVFGQALLDHDDEHDEEEKDDDDEHEEEKDDADKGKGHDKKDKGGHNEDDNDSDEGNGEEPENDDDGKGDDSPPDNSHNPEHNAPFAQPQTLFTGEDTPTRIVLRGSDGNGDKISFSVVEEPQHGKLEQLDSSNGTVSYSPSGDFYGRDSFTFKVSDGSRDSLPAVVTIHVTSINDPPIALGGEIRTTEGKSLSFGLIATDAENDTLSYVIVSDPASGTLTGVAPDLKYAPANQFHGSDSLTFKVNDGSLDSNVATLAITVRSEDKDDRKDRDRWWETPPDVTQDVDEIALPPIIDEVTPPSSSTNNIAVFDEPQQVILPSIFTIDPLAATQNPIGDLIYTQTVLENTPAALVIKDILAPRLIFPASTLEVFATSDTGTVVTYAVQALDDADGEITALCSPSSGSTFPVGRFNVICQATDAAGNAALNSFVVVVRLASIEENTSLSFLLSTVVTALLGAGTYLGLRLVKRTKPK